MNTRSLRLRLMGMAASAVGLALVLAWAALSLLFERHVDRQAQSDLERLGGVLAASLSLDAAGAPQLGAPPSDPRLQTPGGGLYWRLSTDAGVLASRSLWDGALPSEAGVRSNGWTAQFGAGPFEETVRQAAREIRPSAEGPAVLIQVAADHAFADAAQAAFAGELAVSLAILWLFLLLAAWTQIVWGLKPLTAVRQALDQLQEDPNARLSADAFPAEVAPLAHKINALADARAGEMARARLRAQNLAHSLKTPLTALKLQASGLPQPDRADVERSLSVLEQAVNSELAAASLAGSDVATLLPVRALLDRLISVIARAYANTSVRFVNLSSDADRLRMAEDGAMDLFGALIDNAAKHAQLQVRITTRQDTDGLSIWIDDDGPGIAEEQMSAAMQRGVRLDQRGPGQGLGLAIACDLAQTSGGALSLARSDLGGLSARLRWPGERARPDRRR